MTPPYSQPGTMVPLESTHRLKTLLAFAIIYFVRGSYVWLIHHESPTKVGTYAYVNPWWWRFCSDIFWAGKRWVREPSSGHSWF